MKVHFIAIGGSIMHNLALALKRSGDVVSGSDDEIYEPSKTRLAQAGLLPPETGWQPQRIHEDLDAVILGMHARADNPELLRALELNIPVFSFPAFVASRIRSKTRVVVAGSHGKTTTTSMIMHVLNGLGRDFDYLVGAQLPEFDLMVRLSDAPLVILEGDEYLSSALDRRPKFVHYDPHIAIVTGVAWDHMNVFPTNADYERQFFEFLTSLQPGAKAFLAGTDHILRRSGESANLNATVSFYQPYPHRYEQGTALAINLESGEEYPMQFFGAHNFENMSAAFEVCRELGVQTSEFLKQMQSFRGAALRMQTVLEQDHLVVIRDFAHAPSKVRATVDAVREKYPDEPITAILELHTYSSLNRDFLPHYKNTLASADRRIVYFSPETLKIKKLQPVDSQFIAECFGDKVVVVTSSSEIPAQLGDTQIGVHIWMSSGRFGGLPVNDLYTTSHHP